MNKTVIQYNYKKDTITNTIAQILYLVVLWLMTIITPRLSTSADAGIFTIALSVSNICTAIATYSINFFIASDIKHKYGDQHYFFFGLMSTTLSLLVSFVITLSFGYHYDSFLFWAVILYYLFKCAENITIIITANMQRAGKLYISSYALMIKAIVCLLIFTLTLFLSRNLVLTFGLLMGFSLLYLIFVDCRLLKKYTNVDYSINKIILKTSLFIFIAALPTFIYGITFASIVSYPRLILQQVTSKEIVGYFGSMAAVATLIQSGLSALFMPFLPLISNYYAEHKYKQLLKLLLIFVLFIVVITMIAFICSLFLDKWLMGIIYPADQEAINYAIYFRWIILINGLQAFVILVCLTMISLRTLIPLAIISIVSLALMFLTSHLLIPDYLIMGVIYSYSISYGLMALAGIVIIYLALKDKLSTKMITY